MAVSRFNDRVTTFPKKQRPPYVAMRPPITYLAKNVVIV